MRATLDNHAATRRTLSIWNCETQRVQSTRQTLSTTHCFTEMSSGFVGTPKIDHGVDRNGSLTSIPIQVSPAQMAPEITLSYHSASNSASAIGMGWAITGVFSIRRSPGTIAQDGFRGELLPVHADSESNHCPTGVIKNNNKDRFSLNGQRLMNISNTQYHYELEQWQKIVAAQGSNPDSWVEGLPEGSKRTYGAFDSSIRAIGASATRVWSATEYTYAFSNYVSYFYINDTSSSSWPRRRFLRLSDFLRRQSQSRNGTPASAKFYLQNWT
ncbi:hypothetical protein BDN71DRAFT_1107713 [Pleurotus eryngii]|uniref:Uncharacterized protein n=1 Tax=Pleurotus eryngii TaxID=5323 RepID=A0A9P5ZVZ0_PLEER|nr:hypothetical protein BDN71DRAFT_1107713 [Pleurotus eryngii]